MPLAQRRPGRLTRRAHPARHGTILIVAALALPATAQTFNGFAGLPRVNVAQLLSGVVALDYDQDGDMDAAVVNIGLTGQPGSLLMLANNGSGVFALDWSVPLGVDPGTPVAGNLDSTALPEIVIPNRGANTVSVVRLQPGGSPGVVTNYTVQASPTAVALGDFNSDGRTDIACVSRTNEEVRVLLGNGTGFPTTRTFFTGPDSGPGASPRSIAAGDLNGDGRPDLVTANIGSSDIGVFYNAGNANFFTKDFGIYIDEPIDPYDARLADMDQDGDLDIVIARGHGDAEVVWRRNAFSSGEVFPDFNDGSFTTFTDGRQVRLTIADIDCNGDNRPDVLGANEGNGEPTFMAVLINTASGPLSHRPPAFYGSGSVQHIAVADFDNDGDNDAFVVNLFGSIRVFLNLCQGINCPADLNASGTLDFFDAVAFLSRYNAQDPVADLAAPAGVFNFFDVTAYLAMFNAGCP